ncbi:MAG: ABC transporter substrate-binding protein [Candidatus Electrothrix communis]|nr:MAG: ABC transporter substrate-binding protein [Candidatus Electrothrix communis]
MMAKKFALTVHQNTQEDGDSLMALIQRCTLSLIFILFFGIICFASNSEIRIADPSGDWGFPTPYRHYPRGPGYIRMSMIFDTLIWKDTTGVIPALAESWSYEPETLSYLFTLRQGVKWHDGRPFTPADVVFTFQYIKEHAYNFVRLDSVASCEIEGEYQVRVKLREPYAPFLAYMATMPILPKHVWNKVSDPKKYVQPDSFIGTGPYTFVDFHKVKGTYLFEAFADYYQGRPKIDRLIYIKADDPLLALLTGKADLAQIEPNMVKILEKKGMTILRNQRGWNKKLMINHTKEPFSNKEFRHALAHAINRQEIIDKAHQGHGTVASDGLLSPDHEFYNPKTPSYEYNPAKARKILTSLGYTHGKDGFFTKDGKPLRVRLLASTVTTTDRDGEIIRHQLEQVGIAVDLQMQEKTAADTQIKAWDFDLAVSGHGGLLGDAVILNRMISPDTGSVNSARYAGSTKLLRLLKEQLHTTGKEKRRLILAEIQKIYAEELPALSLYYPESTAAYNPKKGISWYFTPGGIGTGIPICQNKAALLR